MQVKLEAGKVYAEKVKRRRCAATEPTVKGPYDPRKWLEANALAHVALHTARTSASLGKIKWKLAIAYKAWARALAREAIYKANGNKSDVACVGRKVKVLHVDLATMKFFCKETRRELVVLYF